MRKRLLLLVLIVALAVTLISCTNKESQQPKGDQGGTPQTQECEDIDVSAVVVSQWQKSAHSLATEGNSFSEEGLTEGCLPCHNGYAFQQNTTSLDNIGIIDGASCDTCHIMHGLDLMDAGTIDLPIGTIKAGTGTVCVACHYGRGKEPNQADAPHHSVQTDMLFAKSGAQVEGFTYGSSPHKTAANTCLACHMTADDQNVRDHLFKMNEKYIDKSCGACHDYDTFNPKAAGDYDGNGKTEGIQDEVSGLMSKLDEAILGQLDGGKYVSSHGGIVFQDAAGNDLEAPPSADLYNAAWNYFFVEYDGSRGVHNATYAVQLLQQSYKVVTGQDVPGADIRK